MYFSLSASVEQVTDTLAHTVTTPAMAPLGGIADGEAVPGGGAMDPVGWAPVLPRPTPQREPVLEAGVSEVGAVAAPAPALHQVRRLWSMIYLIFFIRIQCSTLFK